MLRDFGLAAIFVTAVFGAASARSSEGIEWHAVLNSLPSDACVQSAVSHTSGLSLASYKHDHGSSFFSGRERTDDYFILVADLNMLVRSADMGLHVTSGPHHPPRLSLNYGYSTKYDAITDVAAKALFENIAASCALPDLARQVKKEHHTHWDLNPLPEF